MRIHRTPAREQGFTVIELLVGAAISTLVLGVISQALIVSWRTTGLATDRLAESHDNQTLTTRLLPDLISAQGTPDTNAGTGTGCVSTPSGTTNVLRLQWVDLSTGTQYSASYRISASRLVRYFCTGGGSPSETVVVRELGAVAPVVTVSGQRVSIRVTERSGYAYTVTGDRRATT